MQISCGYYCVIIRTLCTHIWNDFPEVMFMIDFLGMVDANYNRAAQLLTPDLVQNMKGRMSTEEKEKRMRGILGIIKPCNRLLYLSRKIKQLYHNF